MAFIHRSQGRRQLHKRGGLAEVGAVREAVPQSRPFPPPQTARDEVDMEVAPPLTGAVPAALYTVQDLLLQFLPLLLLLGQSLGCWL